MNRMLTRSKEQLNAGRIAIVDESRREHLALKNENKLRTIDCMDGCLDIVFGMPQA